MRRFGQVFRLEMTALVRSRTLAMLTVVSLAWMIVFPLVIRGDGTPEGLRELTIRYSLGGVFALLVLALVASATGSLAKERAARRLQLTLVRPVRYLTVAVGKIAAHVAVGAFVLALAAIPLACRFDLGRPCSHVLSPVLQSPRDEAKAMYESYMKDPATPEAVRRTKKEVVLRLLTQKSVDRYQTIPTNSTASWRFPIGHPLVSLPGVSVRMRFTNQYEMRQDLLGAFRLGGWHASVSNITQSVLTVPLVSEGVSSAEDELKFDNLGKQSLMLRPRKDICLLVPADAFWANLLRAWVEMVAVLALVIAFGVFLSAALGRPVALFVAVVTLAVGEIAPSVVEQYPDSLETDRIDRLGLAISRVAMEITHPISALSPMEALSKDECVEPMQVLRTVLIDLLVVPLVLALLSAFVLPRKHLDT